MQFRILRLLEKRPEASQREIAAKLGISLGTINYCLKTLVAHGHIKPDNFRALSNKLGYLYVLTPEGIVHRAQLATGFIARRYAEFQALHRELASLFDDYPEARHGVGVTGADGLLPLFAAQWRRHRRRPSAFIQDMGKARSMAHLDNFNTVRFDREQLTRGILVQRHVFMQTVRKQRSFWRSLMAECRRLDKRSFGRAKRMRGGSRWGGHFIQPRYGRRIVSVSGVRNASVAITLAEVVGVLDALAAAVLDRELDDALGAAAFRKGAGHDELATANASGRQRRPKDGAGGIT